MLQNAAFPECFTLLFDKNGKLGQSKSFRTLFWHRVKFYFHTQKGWSFSTAKNILIEEFLINFLSEKRSKTARFRRWKAIISRECADENSRKNTPQKSNKNIYITPTKYVLPIYPCFQTLIKQRTHILRQPRRLFNIDILEKTNLKRSRGRSAVVRVFCPS